MAPQARTVAADLENRSGVHIVPTPTGTDSEVTESSLADSTKDSKSIIVPKDELPPHPDDIIHKFWYETLVRLRMTFFVLLSLLLMLALSLGMAMQMFFSVMVIKAMSAKVVFGIILVPLQLLVSAVMVDEMIDVGLDAMDLPTFGLFRASMTASLRSFFPSWNTRKTEICLLVILEVFPVTVGLICLPEHQGHMSWYTRFLMGYIIGGVLSAYVISVVYVLSHIYVGHNPLTEARMNVLWHNMGNLGELKHVQHDVLEADSDDVSVRWKGCVSFLFAAVCCVICILLTFLFWKNFVFMFTGLMLTTVFLALALTAYAPKLLGKAFWLTLVFFVLLTAGLTIGTTATMPEKKNFIPTALGPGASGYGANLSDDNGLPLQFLQRPTGATQPGYPICSMSWGTPNTTASAAQKLNIFDLAMLTKASYAPESLTEWALGAMLNGTDLEEFEVIENQPDDKIGRLVVIELPKQKVRVMAVRGTAIVGDVYADLQIYCAIAVLQFMGHVVPVLKAMPTNMMQGLLKSSPARAIFDSVDNRFLKELQGHAEMHKKQAAEKGFSFLVTGHSLGGALAGIVSAKLGVEGLGVSAPGLRYQLDRMELIASDLQHGFTEIEPTNDLVPKIDEQRGMVSWIKCDISLLSCHSLVKTTCELWSQCGDPRGRDYRRLCSQWYSQAEMNM